MGKSQSKPPSHPIQSYIDYVTDKNKQLWQKDLSPSDNLMNMQEIHQRPVAFLRSPTKTKKSILNFLYLCTYKEQKTEIFDQSDVKFESFSFKTSHFKDMEILPYRQINATSRPI